MLLETQILHDHDAVHAENNIDPVVESSLMSIINFLKTQPCTEQIYKGKTVLQAYSIENGFPNLPLVAFTPESIIQNYCFDFSRGLNLSMTIEKSHSTRCIIFVEETCRLTVNDTPKGQLHKATVILHANEKPIIYVYSYDFWINMAKNLQNINQ